MISVNDYIYLPKEEFSDQFLEKLRKDMTFEQTKVAKAVNPNKREESIPKVDKLYRESHVHLLLPRGYLPLLVERLQESHLEYQIKDFTMDSQSVLKAPKPLVKGHHLPILTDLIKKGGGTLFSKEINNNSTQIMLNLINRLNQSAIWVVNSDERMEQLISYAYDKIGMQIEEVGKIDSQNWKIGQRVTLTTLQHLSTETNLDKIISCFGILVGEDGDNFSKETFFEVATMFPAKFRYFVRSGPMEKLFPHVFLTVGAEFTMVNSSLNILKE